MQEVKNYIKTQIPEDFQKLKGPLMVIVQFNLPITVQLQGAKRRNMHNNLHIIRPDGDNLEKFLNDCLNGLIWEDDRQVSVLLRTKIMTSDKVGFTKLFIYQFEERLMNTSLIKEIIDKNFN